VAYVIAEPCIGVKDSSCVEVCPVDCIHPTPDEPGYDAVEMLYIDPEECIDCDACVEACPVDAIFAEDQLPEEWRRFATINADYYQRERAIGPLIQRAEDPTLPPPPARDVARRRAGRPPEW
jgi:ferredoxin